jgi:cell division protein FtsB
MVGRSPKTIRRHKGGEVKDAVDILNEVIADLKKRIAELEAENRKLTARVEELEGE